MRERSGVEASEAGWLWRRFARMVGVLYERTGARGGNDSASRDTRASGDTGALRDQGDAARDRRDWAEAERLYREYLAAAPEDFDIWVQAGHAAKEGGRLDEAWDAYGCARALAPGDADLIIHMSDLALRTARYGEALVLFQLMVERDLGDARAQSGLSKARLGLRAPDAFALLDSAERARDAGDWRRATFYYDRYLGAADDDVDAFVQAGHAEKESGRFGAALMRYEAALRLAPENADIRLQLGHLARLRAEDGEAARWYRSALERDTSCADAREALRDPALLASMYADNKSADIGPADVESLSGREADIPFDAALIDDPAALDVAIKEATQGEDFLRAAAFVRWRVRQSPDDVEAWRALADALERADRHADAARAREIAANLAVRLK